MKSPMKLLMELLTTLGGSKASDKGSEITSRTFLLLGIGAESFPAASPSEVGCGSPPWHSCMLGDYLELSALTILGSTRGI